MTRKDHEIRVLFVDDEKFVLDAIKRTVRKSFECEFAEGGQAALDFLAMGKEFAVVCTDMRMPSVNGVDVLKAFRDQAPSTSRILLTGQADLDAAMAAVNEGNVFRFLTKPTDPDQLGAAIRDADKLHRLHKAEQELLEQTLRGSVQALLETLSLANPLAFARAQRIRTYVDRLLAHLDVENQWEVEVAAMLSQIGAVTLPTRVSERLNSGITLSREEEEMVSALSEVADRLLAGIPRLENVRNMISSQRYWEAAKAPTAAKLLKLASELDTLTERGLEPEVISVRINERSNSYGQDLIRSFNAVMNSGDSSQSICLVNVNELVIGMRLAGDVRARDGLLLVGRGQEVTESLLDRIRNFEQASGLAEDSVAVFEASRA